MYICACTYIYAKLYAIFFSANLFRLARPTFYQKLAPQKNSKSLNSGNITNLRIRIFQMAMRRVEHRRIRNIGIREDTDHVEVFEYFKEIKIS